MSPLLDHLLAAKYWGWLLSGFSVTIASSLLVIVASTILGILFAVARTARFAPVRGLAAVYLSIFRNTPLLVQLFFWYFGVPSLLPEGFTQWMTSGHSIALGPLTLTKPSLEFSAAVIGMIFYATAYVGEEIRAALNSVPRSQVLAAQSLGMTPWQSLRYVVLPQGLAKIVAPLFGQYMNIIKNTSLGMTIGLVELSYRSRQAEAETFQSFQVYGIATVLYILLIVALEFASRAVERRRQWGQVNLSRA